MAEYIEREEFLEDFEKRYCLPCKEYGRDYNGRRCRSCWVESVHGEIMGAPTADVAPVVRCKDCKHSYVSIDARCCSYGAFYDVAVPDDFFCAFAERKDVNEK